MVEKLPIDIRKYPSILISQTEETEQTPICTLISADCVAGSVELVGNQYFFKDIAKAPRTCFTCKICMTKGS